MFKHFKWICPSAKYVMKTDDDIFVNTKLIEDMLNRNNDENTIFGYVKNFVRPIRDPESKWHMPYWIYGRKYYPTFTTGGGYIIPG